MENLKSKTLENRITFKNPKKNQVNFEKSIVFYSFAWSRLLAGLMLFGFGITDYFLLGHLIGHPGEEAIGEYIGQGSAVFLGGVSFFYTVGLIPLLVGSWLILYSIFSSFKGEISKSKSGSTFYFHEKRLILPQFTEFKRTAINRMRIRDNHLGPKKLWYYLFIPMSITIFNFGFALFGEHRAADEILPTMMVLTAFGNLIALGILVIFPQSFVEFSSSDKIYDTWVVPLMSKEIFLKSLLEIFDFNNTQSDISNNSENEDVSGLLLENNGEITVEASNIEIKSQKNYLRLIFGFTLILAAVISLSFEILFSKSFSGIAATYGILLVVQAFNFDFSDNISLNFDSHTKKLRFKKYFGKRIQVELLNQIDDVKLSDSFRKFDIFDIVSMLVLIYLSSFESVWGWKFVDFSNWLIFIDSVLKTLFCILILLIFMYYWAIPNPSFRVSGSKIENYYLEIPGNHSFKQIFKKAIKKIKKTATDPQNKKMFYLRACAIFSIHLISGLVALLII
ncbi:MAG: hypothetical protein ACTSWX_01195 [Promethearchaeota archaeon]